ncbi:UDP-N-acetylmuramoyl-tripeptide--D-alanyl-D-alanine ligase [Thermoleophilia bacterium SCSIO 60948]|nr:UDP-N-acetylmuramoyl-tripeptide--D-alanyl-D-alanine ligase [Thermoleophilia bacterium SCSIO 60948]
MIELDPDRVASAMAAGLARRGGPGRPERGEIDSRQIEPGCLFFGLTGGARDGGEFAAAAIEAGAWGVVVERARAAELAGASPEGRDPWVFAVEDPLAALQALATEWRRELAVPVVGITGSVGKTSVKDMTRALLPVRAHASPENFNTEIGLPLTILSAPPETQVLVLEMAMRGAGQIAELCEIAEPDVAAITNVGPVHLELLGTIEAIAEAKAEILTGLKPGGRAVVPVDAEALAPHLDDTLDALTFGPGGDVFAREVIRGEGHTEALIATPDGEARFDLPFEESYNLINAVAAVAIGVALGHGPEAMATRTAGIAFSRLRGELIELPADGIRLINDCYNANPVSMTAAIDNLAATHAEGRRIGVLGGMAELGPDAPALHREVAAHARGAGIDLLIGVGELARDLSPDEWVAEPEQAVDVARRHSGRGDVILVKGSRSVGLERFTDGFVARGS